MRRMLKSRQTMINYSQRVNISKYYMYSHRKRIKNRDAFKNSTDHNRPDQIETDNEGQKHCSKNQSTTHKNTHAFDVSIYMPESHGH